MAITHVNTTTATDPNTGSVTVTKPSGTTSGDVLLVFGAGPQDSWGIPSGFTQIGVTTDGDMGAAFRMYAWYKVCGGSEPSNYTFTNATAGSTGYPMIVTMHCWRGVDNSTPIAHSSITGSAGVSEPANPATSLTQTANGRLMFARGVRRTSSSSGTAQLPTFSFSTSGWSELADAADFSGGTVNYGIGAYAQTSDTGAGSRTEPAVTCSQTEVANGYFLVELKTAVTPASGGFTVNAGHVTVSGAGNAHDDGALAVQLGHATLDFNGTHFPPGEGVLDFQLSPVGMQFEAEGVGGPMAVQLQHVSVDLSGGLIHGGFSMELSKVEPVEFTGSVNPIGGFSAQLGSVTMQFVGETRPFGAQVIFIEPEKRGLRISQDDTTPIYASEVTQE